ncbi:MAG: Gx transporter family protein [Tissierellia bacterium]|nr:Gx transporter family protein [Tissierellia bacterium]
MKNKRLTYVAMGALLAAMISYIEVFFTPFIPIPGMKLGFSNLVLLIGLLYLPFGDVLLIGLMKTIFIVLFTGAVSSMFYSMPATFVSILTMRCGMVAKPYISNVGVSVFGSLGNNMTQVIVSYFMLQSTAYFYYLPMMILVGTLTGSIIGFIANEMEKRSIFRRQEWNRRK